MASDKSIRKKIVEYLCSKGYERSVIKEDYKVEYLEMGNPNACFVFDIAVVDTNSHVLEFYEIKSKVISSIDVRKHNSKYEEYKRIVSTESLLSDGALGFLVTFDNKKKDFDLYLITEDIDDLSSYVNVILRIAKIQNGYTNYYRGQGNIEYSLLPSLYRKPSMPSKETDLYKEAIRRCPDDFSDLSSTFQHLVKLQHYGIPTRLLDLTSNALIALYFAVEKKEYSTSGKRKKLMDGVVFVFTVGEKSIKSYDSDAVSVLANLARVHTFNMPKLPCDVDSFNNENDTCLLLHEIRYEKPHFQPVINPEDMNKTFCVKPKLDNSRIRQQSGAFFIYGIGNNKNTCSPLKEHPINIVIDSKYKDKLKKELACFGITDAYVYPEMDHVMQNIKEEFKL